jgi:hypothetical protein
MGGRYAFRVTGRLTPALLHVLDPLEASVDETDTVLVGPVVDRAALHGFIARIEALGLDLIELRRLPQREPGVDGHRCTSCGNDVTVLPDVTGPPDVTGQAVRRSRG